jgi:hypothetical protein
MKLSRFTPGQILQALRQAEGRTVVGEVCRKLSVTEATFYRWRKHYAGLEVGELRELRVCKYNQIPAVRKQAISRRYHPQDGRGSAARGPSRLGLSRAPSSRSR